MIHRITMPLACLSLAAVAYAKGEWLYAQTGNGLQVYDPQTGEHLQSAYFPGVYGGSGLIYEGGRLFMMSQDGPAAPDHVVEIHPAIGTYELIGDTGLNVPWAIVGLALDPITGEHYLIDSAGGIYDVDVASGQVSFLVRMEAKVTIISAIAIDSHGIAYGFGTPSIWYPIPALYRVDLHSGDLERIGDFQGNPLHFTTLTFDSQDRLWGAGIGLYSNQDYRIYRIDLETLELHSTFALPDEWPSVHAIAFGPEPEVATYCESKTNSEGCAPSIDWMGHPSATANLGFDVSCAEVVSDAQGFLMLGFGGQASVPFQGGTLCLADPIEHTLPQTSAGAGGCSGVWSLDVNTWLFSKHPLEPGNRFTCQWWGRDPGLSGPLSSQLSNALEVVLLP